MPPWNLTNRLWKNRRLLLDLALFLGLAAILAWLGTRGARSIGYHWQWYRIPRYLLSEHNGVWTAGPLLKGLWVTVQITALSFLLTLALGLASALFALSRSPVARLVSRVYVETIRNTPLLIQIFFLYFVVAPVLGLGRFPSAVIALSLFEGAYASEILRSGIVSLPTGQWEAAWSLGLSRNQTYRRVILPQAFRRVLPPLASQTISLVKDSALVSVIAVYDLTMEGQAVVSETFLTFEVWFTVAAIYLAMALVLSFFSLSLEKRLSMGQ